MKQSKKLLWRILSLSLCLVMMVSAMMIAPSAETPIENLYDKSTAFAGYITGANAEKESASHYTSTPIAVTEGDVITFGPCKTQDFYLHGYDSSSEIKDSTVGIAKLTQGESFGNYFILSYTVPAGVTSVRVVNASAINDIFVITKNNEFGVSQFLAYWDWENNDTFATKYGAQFEKKNTPALYQKSALFVGDSISCGSQEGSLFYRAWAGRIGVVNSMDYVNASVSGASCSTTRATNRIVSQLLAHRDSEFDYVVMHGGVNDAWDTAPVGEMVNGFDFEDFDTTTFAGGLEQMFYYANVLYPNSRMGYIMNFKAPNCTKGTVANMDDYFAVAKEICEKWNIPVLNLYEDEDFCNNVLKTNTTENLPDNIHPNTHGYDLLYPVIEEWMETLPANTLDLGVENTAIKLSTEADLEYIRTYPEADFELASDIVITKAWTPIPTFSGILDGKGHTISGISIVDAAKSNWSNSGFIQHANGCTIKNLTLQGSINNTAPGVAVQIGGFAGQASDASFINCTSKVNITTGDTSGRVFVGGIVGVVSGNKTATLTNCVNRGTINASNATGAYTYVGGFIGQASGKATIMGGVNYGAITVNCGEAVYGQVAGILCADAGGGSTLIGVVNRGAVTGNGQAAGIMHATKGTAILTDVVNYGAVTAGNEIGSGILGTDAGGATLTGAVNFGTVTVTGRYLSGIIANSSVATKASYCTNLGTLNGTYSGTNGQFYGQIIGRLTKTGGTFTSCLGLGEYVVNTGSGNYIGGIGGSTNTSTYINCYTSYSAVLGYIGNAVTTNCAVITAESNLEAVVAALNTGCTPGNEAFVLDGGKIEPVYELNKVPSQVYATQEGTIAGGVVDIRILALVNSLNYDLAGVKITNVNGTDVPENKGKYDTTTVYSGVLDGNTTLDAPYGTYYMPITLKNVTATGTFTVTVKTFVQTDGQPTQYGDTYTITVNNGVVVSTVKN